MITLFSLKDYQILQIRQGNLIRYKKKNTITIMINRINMGRDVNTDTLIQNLKRKNTIIMEMITEAMDMDMPDMTMRI